MLQYRSMEMNLAEIEYASMLYDFYGALLTDNEREVMEFYHESDLSLAEIADVMHISRQGVHYTLKKAEKELEKYEKKLGLIAAYNNGVRLLCEAEGIGEELCGDETLPPAALDNIERLLNIVRELTEQQI